MFDEFLFYRKKKDKKKERYIREVVGETCLDDW